MDKGIDIVSWNNNTTISVDHQTFADNSCKRKSKSDEKEDAKMARLSSHVIGESCDCTRYECFHETTEGQRFVLIQTLNNMKSKDEQDAFLSEMIEVTNVQRRRSRKPEGEEHFKDYSYSYYVYVFESGGRILKKPVCHKAFLSIFGITNRRVQTIKACLAYTGLPPKDQRGRHDGRKRVPEGAISKVREHIQSFQGCSRHFNFNKSEVLYLPKQLNISKLYNLFCVKYPDLKLVIKYEKYRQIFNSDYNITFGFPVNESCSQCDEIIARLNKNQSKIAEDTDNNELRISSLKDES